MAEKQEQVEPQQTASDKNHLGHHTESTPSVSAEQPTRVLAINSRFPHLRQPFRSPTSRTPPVLHAHFLINESPSRLFSVKIGLSLR